MRSDTSGPRPYLYRILRSVTSLSDRRYQRCLERNEEWIRQARNAPTVREQEDRQRRR